MLKKELKKFNLKMLLVGHIVFHSSDYAFDYLLYPFVIFTYGPLYGGIVMTILASVICLSIAYVYDLLEKDWLGVESVKELVEKFFEEEEEIARKGLRRKKQSLKRKGKRLLYWIFQKNKWGQFIFLTIHFDPLITTIYMRPGYHLYNGFSRRDWKIFWASTVVSNAWWTGVAFVAVSALKGLIVRFF
ncbi:MAG: hypothetical protein ACD_9C00004G0002 [uncultured bacterium]|nr:MAG: hypothetical protein ACD_9C00004G0002 [uncultured bacterium]